MVDHLVVGNLVIADARQIHHPRSGAAACETDIRLRRFTWTIDHTADNRQRHRR